MPRPKASQPDWRRSLAVLSTLSSVEGFTLSGVEGLALFSLSPPLADEGSSTKGRGWESQRGGILNFPQLIHTASAGVRLSPAKYNCIVRRFTVQ